MKKCTNCHKELEDDSKYCLYCGALQTTEEHIDSECAQAENTESEKMTEKPIVSGNGENASDAEKNTKDLFFKKSWFMWVMLFVFAPVGIFLMFKYGNIKKIGKIIVSGGAVIFFILLYLVILPVTISIANMNASAKALYEDAVVYFEDRSFEASIENLEVILDRYPQSKVADNAENLYDDVREEYASALLDQSKRDCDDGKYLDAFDALQLILSDYSDTEVITEAQEYIKTVESGYANNLYQEATKNYQNKEYLDAMEKLDIIISQYSHTQTYDSAKQLYNEAGNAYAKSLYQNAKSKYDAKDFDAAISKLESLISDYPETNIISKAKTLLSQANEAKKKAEPVYPGMYKVGRDIYAGEYVLIANSWCYFEICSDSTGSFSSIIANDNITTHTYITLKDGQYFEFDDGKIIMAEYYSETFGPVNGVYIEGMYKVGIDIPAGEYKIVAVDGGGYYEINKNSTHTFGSIISNDFFNGEKYLTIKDGQYLDLSDAELIAK